MKKIYSKYKYLLDDESFVSWLLGKENCEWDYWKANKLVHTKFIESITDLLREMKPRERQMSEREKVHLWGKISTNLNASQKIKNLSLRIWMQSAAALILILFSVSIFRLNEVQVKCLHAQHIQHYLPDSSLVELNSGSELSYNKLMWKMSRNVYMKGEAYYKVKKGAKFTVKANRMQVSVLGTSFNVYAHEEYKVDCFTGKVAVDFEGVEQGTVLTKGMGVRKYQDKLDRYIHKQNITPLWTKGEFYFNNASYLNVFDELERQFNIQVLNKTSFTNKTYTGFFTNKSLAEAFDMVLSPISYNIQKKGDAFLVVKE